MNNLSLLLTSDIADILVAARDCQIFTGYLLARGYDATIASTFWAMLRTTPWRDKNVMEAPWRVVRSAMD